jgi:hypothetical protein
LKRGREGKGRLGNGGEMDEDEDEERRVKDERRKCKYEDCGWRKEEDTY